MSANPPTADRLYFRPAIPVTLALMAGIVLGDKLPGGMLPALAVLAVAGSRLAGRLARRGTAGWSPLLAVAAAGYLAMVPWASPRFGPNHLVHHIDDAFWQISGSVAEAPAARLGRTRLVLEVDGLSRQKIQQPVHGRIRLTIMGDVSLAPGDRVAFASRLRPLRNFNNPGGFDYRRHMAFEGVYASAWVKAENLHIDGSGVQRPAPRILDGLRRKMGRAIDTAGKANDADEKAVLKALVYGDRSGIDDALRERFNRSGAGHLLAISGLHVGIVAAVAYRCLVWVLSFFPPLLWRGWSRQWAAALTAAIVVGYGMLAGMSPSTQRAVGMVTVILAALILGRTHDILNTLAVAALAILVIFPPALFSISFQLSFAAVLSIVVGMEKLGLTGVNTSRSGSTLGRRLAAFVLVSALAIAGTTPLALYYFNQTSLVGIAANLLLVPLVGFLAVPLGLIAAVAAVFSPHLAAAGFSVCIAILHLALAAADWFAGLSFAAVKTITPSVFEIVLYYLAGWALLNLKRTRLAPWLLSASLTLAAGDVLYWSHQRFWHSDLRVTAVDVGQGAATLMELPGGKVILVDGGGFADNRFFDMGRLVIAPLLWSRKIATVDVLVLSHPNADHLNGLIYVARHFAVRELWTNGDANTTWGYRELMNVCRERSIVVKALDRSHGKLSFDPVALEILHPPARSREHADARDQEDRNDLSLVLRAAYGRTAFLLTGDITARAEAMLVQGAGDERLAGTVLFAPHHGSRTSSSPALIAAVRPAAVVISDGAGNRFGFPHPEVVARYRRAGSRVYCTGTHGAIALYSNGRSVRIETFSGDRDEFTARP